MPRLNYANFEKLMCKYYEPLTNLSGMSDLLIPAAFTEVESRQYVDSTETTAISRYRTGERAFPAKIIEPYKQPDVRNRVAPYFAKNITDNFPPERIADLRRELWWIIQADWYIAGDQKNEFERLATAGSLNDFLVEAYIYAIKQDNAVPLDTTFPFNNFTDKPTPHFIGREDTIKAIHDCFRQGESVSLTQTISGLGGVGKTQVAMEYAHRYAHEYDVIWWIVAENLEDIYKKILDFVKRKKLLKDNNDNTVILGNFLSWFENNTNWLIIYDNVEDFQALKPFLPKKDNGNILITTRATQCCIGNRIDIDLFDEPMAISFLQKRTGINDASSAKLLAERLGYLPLALELAAAYITAVPDMDFAMYLPLLKDSALTTLNKGAALTDYGKTVRAAWQISIDKIQLESARQLLNLCAYFAPDEIPLSAFIREAECLWEWKLPAEEDIENGEEIPESYLPVPLRDELRDKLQCNQIILELTKYSLVKYEKGFLHIHRLLQEVIRDDLKADTIIIEQCLEMIDQILEMHDYEPASYEEHYNNLPHVCSIVSFMEPLLEDGEISDLFFQSVCHRLGINFNFYGEYEKAIEYYTKALESDGYSRVCHDYESVHEDAGTIKELGDAYSRLGDYDIALHFYNSVLAVCDSYEEFEGLVLTATDVCCDIAKIYTELGKSDIALEWYLKGLAYHSSEVVEATPETILEAYEKLAMSPPQLNKDDDLPLFDIEDGDLIKDDDLPFPNINNNTLLLITEKVVENLFGYGSPRMIDILYIIADYNKKVGDYDFAQIYYRELLEIKEKTLPPDHPEILLLKTEIAICNDKIKIEPF
ncbi:MAG: NB-ARC domain-containing protein [Firmicutes bacterium]|nr:NB-ARC domain-containing protein [Bacillota bacterium]